MFKPNPEKPPQTPSGGNLGQQWEIISQQRFHPGDGRGWGDTQRGYPGLSAWLASFQGQLCHRRTSEQTFQNSQVWLSVHYVTSRTFLLDYSASLENYSRGINKISPVCLLQHYTALLICAHSYCTNIVHDITLAEKMMIVGPASFHKIIFRVILLLLNEACSVCSTCCTNISKYVGMKLLISPTDTECRLLISSLIHLLYCLSCQRASDSP